MSECPNCGHRFETRTSAQNRKLWPLLNDVSRQVEWSVDGRVMMLKPDDWKDIFSCSLRKHQRCAEGIDGGSIWLGSRTSRMTKEEFSELIELIYAFGSERGVYWSDPALKAYEQYREAA